MASIFRHFRNATFKNFPLAPPNSALSAFELTLSPLDRVVARHVTSAIGLDITDDSIYSQALGDYPFFVPDLLGRVDRSANSPRFKLHFASPMMDLLDNSTPFHKDLKFILGSELERLYIFEEPPGKRQVKYGEEVHTIYVPYIVHLIYVEAPVNTNHNNAKHDDRTQIFVTQSLLYRMAPLEDPSQLLTEPSYKPALANIAADLTACREDLGDFVEADDLSRSPLECATVMYSSFWDTAFTDAYQDDNLEWFTGRGSLLPIYMAEFTNPQLTSGERYEKNPEKLLQPKRYLPVGNLGALPWFQLLRNQYPQAKRWIYCFVEVPVTRDTDRIKKYCFCKVAKDGEGDGEDSLTLASVLEVIDTDLSFKTLFIRTCKMHCGFYIVARGAIDPPSDDVNSQSLKWVEVANYQRFRNHDPSIIASMDPVKIKLTI